jgi:hypothetical protein
MAIRSDDRDFVDDMLDGIYDAPMVDPVVAQQMAASSIRLIAQQPPPPPGATNLFGLPGKEIPAAAAVHSPVPLAQTTSGNYVPVAAGAGGASPLSQSSQGAQVLSGAALSTLPATAAIIPGLETPGISAQLGSAAAAAGDLASMITSVTDPRLRQIIGNLRAMRVQTQATSEHAALTAQDNFRKSVTARLARIESRLPAGSLRNQVNLTRARIIPVMLG